MMVRTYSLQRARSLVDIEHFIVAEPIVDDDVPVLSSPPLVVVADAEAELVSQDGECQHTVV